jgi:hypothetical protein
MEMRGSSTSIPRRRHALLEMFGHAAVVVPLAGEGGCLESAEKQRRRVIAR